MKRALKTTLVLILSVFLMTGCAMKENIGFKIGKDEKVSIVMTMAMDDEMIDTYLTIKENPEYMQAENPDDIKVKAHTDAERWAFFDSEDMKDEMGDMQGFTKTKYDKNGFKGYTFTKELGTLADISGDSATARVNITGDTSEPGELKGKTLFIKNGTTYKSNMSIKGSGAGTDQEMSQIEDLGGTIDMSLVVELPVKPTSHNADSTENGGKTLKWSLLGSDKNVDFEFDLSQASAVDDDDEEEDDDDDVKTGSDEEDVKTTGEEKKTSKKSDDDKEDNKTMLYVGIGVGAAVLLLVIVAVAVVASKKKKQNAAAAMQQSQTVMAPNYQPMEPPVQPIQPVQPAQPTEPTDPNNNVQQ